MDRSEHHGTASLLNVVPFLSLRGKAISRRGSGHASSERLPRRNHEQWYVILAGGLIPSPVIGYCILASFILRTILVSYSELLENLGEAFKPTYAKALKCIV
jgi:hypothetical protein